MIRAPSCSFMLPLFGCGSVLQSTTGCIRSFFRVILLVWLWVLQPRACSRVAVFLAPLAGRSGLRQRPVGVRPLQYLVIVLTLTHRSIRMHGSRLYWQAVEFPLRFTRAVKHGELHEKLRNLRRHHRANHNKRHHPGSRQDT